MPKFTYKDLPEMQPMPVGFHDVTIGTGEFTLDKGNDVLKLPFTNAANEAITDRLWLTEKAAWKVEQLIKACVMNDGLEAGDEVDIEENTFEGRKCTIEVAEETYTKDGKEKTVRKIQRYYPLGYRPKVSTKPATASPTETKPAAAPAKRLGGAKEPLFA
jgi:hypothetical protein